MFVLSASKVFPLAYGNTYVAKVIPAKPLIFCALSLRLAVRLPVLFSSLSKYSTEEVQRVGRSDDKIVHGSKELTVLSEDGPEAERSYLG